MKYQLNIIMSNAWEIFKNKVVTLFSKALRLAWRAYKLLMALKNGAVNFTFEKADGTLRDAIGTRCADLFEYTPKGQSSPSNPWLIKFYDLEAQGWRSCRIERVVNIEL